MSERVSNVVSQELVPFHPTVACGDGCKTMWSDGVPCVSRNTDFQTVHGALPENF